VIDYNTSNEFSIVFYVTLEVLFLTRFFLSDILNMPNPLIKMNKIFIEFISFEHLPVASFCLNYIV